MSKIKLKSQWTLKNGVHVLVTNITSDKVETQTTTGKTMRSYSISDFLNKHSPYDMIKSINNIIKNETAESDMNFGSFILGEIWDKRLVNRPDCWYHNNKKVSIVDLHKIYSKIKPQ